MPEEKVFTIPLREAFEKARPKRTPYAMRLVRRYLQQHTKARTIKLGQRLNAAVWARGIKKPPRRIRVKAVIDGDVCKAELLGHEYVEFKPVAAPKKERLLERLRGRLAAERTEEERKEKQVEGKT